MTFRFENLRLLLELFLGLNPLQLLFETFNLFGKSLFFIIRRDGRSLYLGNLARYYEHVRHPLAFDPLPALPGYRTYLAPGISPWDEEGFSSCSASPCHRAAPITPPEWNRLPSQPAAIHAAFTLSVRARPPEHQSSRDHLWVHSRYGPVTRAPTRSWLGQWASDLRSPSNLPSKLQGLWLLPWQDYPLLKIPALPGHTLKSSIRMPPQNLLFPTKIKTSAECSGLLM